MVRTAHPTGILLFSLFSRGGGCRGSGEEGRGDEGLGWGRSARRLYLRDPKDEMVLETAVAGGCSAIISYNKRDFVGAERFNITISSPQELLEAIGALS
jgi:hypothetical protein